MDAYELRAYETCGYWTMVLVRVFSDDRGHVTRELLYKGDHVPIDETDALLRAVLLMERVSADLETVLAADFQTG